MKKLFKIAVVLLLVLVVALVAAFFMLNSYVQSPTFKEKILAAAKEKLGSEVKITELKISLLSGVTLKGVVVANPKGFPGNIITADAFVLRYDLLPLLRKRMQIEELLLDKPVFTLSRDVAGAWNYEKLGSDGVPPTATNLTTATAAAGSGAPVSSPIDISLSKIELRGGQVAMMSEQGKPLVRLDDIRMTASVSLENNQIRGNGNAAIKTISLADALFVRSIASPVAISTDEVKLSALKGTVADGDVSGDMTLKLKCGMRYLANLQVKNGDIEKLLQEAGITKKVINGKLQAVAAIEGTGGLPTIVGSGSAEVVGGTLAQVPLQDLLATLLMLPELRNIKFDQCRIEFTIANSMMQTPVIRVTSPLVQITGKGQVSLADYTLHHDLTLAIAKGTMIDKLPKEIRAAFKERSDGFYALDFKVTGPYDAPKTDIAQRIAKGAGEELLKKGLEGLFKKK